MFVRRTASVLGLLACLLQPGCTAETTDPAAQLSQPIIYDGDDRQEFYEAGDPQLEALIEQSIVTLIPASSLIRQGANLEIDAPQRSEVDMPCSDEPFLEQPTAALCSGVLVDWDLVLTAGHCARALRLDELRVVFGYYYRAPDELALSSAGIHEPIDIVAEDLVRGSDGISVRDYAWLRLDRRVSAPYRPAAIRNSAHGPERASRLTFTAANEGVPIKIDRNASIHEPGSAELDYFVADTDSAKGGSGGGAFDSELVLLGILFRGGPDRVPAEGCERLNRVPGAQAEERFHIARRALDALCEVDPTASSLCRTDCGDPCVALPVPQTPNEGCSVAGPADAPDLGWYVLAVCWLGRRRSRPWPRRANVFVVSTPWGGGFGAA